MVAKQPPAQIDETSIQDDEEGDTKEVIKKKNTWK